MTAIEIIENLMKQNQVTLSELAEYGDFGSKENVFQMLKRNDLKVGTFVKMLEVMGYQLVVENVENDDEIIIDYEED